jgi:hypothetical protein
LRLIGTVNEGFQTEIKALLRICNNHQPREPQGGKLPRAIPQISLLSVGCTGNPIASPHIATNAINVVG